MKRLMFIYLFLAFVCVTMAQKVSEQEALSSAQTFLSSLNEVRQVKKLIYRKKPQLQVTNCLDGIYVFNDKANGGFVVISGDKQMPSVLGYSLEGQFDENKIPSNMRKWLKNYVLQAKGIQSNTTSKVATFQASQMAPIAPLLESKFDQDAPFNDKCPTWGSQTCVTGCVPTALAQILFYYKWPLKTSQVIPSYTTSSNKIYVPEIPITTIDWNNIIPEYHSTLVVESSGNVYYENDFTEKQANAIATLMTLCGSSLKVNYRTDGSSASLGSCVKALVNYFDYEEGVRLYQSKYDFTRWCQIIYDELACGNPLLYDGDGEPDCHAFIIDGYDTDGLFHINWGWGGMCDGYFLLTSLNPMDGYVFNEDQSAIVSVRPCKPGIKVAYGVLNQKSLTFFYDTERNNRAGTICMDIRECASNQMVTQCTFDPSFADYKLWSVKEFFANNENLESVKGLCFMNTSDVVSMWQMFYCCKSLKELDLTNFNTDNVQDMGYMFNQCELLKNLNLSSFNTSKLTRTEGMFKDCRSLSTIYVDEGWIMDKVNSDFWMFVNDFNLVGSNGTRYEYPNYGVEYAHLDGGESNPGYFSKLLKGDVNSDGNVDISDVVALVNIILNSSSNYQVKADLNNDGSIDISDVVAVVNIILGQ